MNSLDLSTEFAEREAKRVADLARVERDLEQLRVAISTWTKHLEAASASLERMNAAARRVNSTLAKLAVARRL